jgi:hypothetical protein
MYPRNVQRNFVNFNAMEGTEKTYGFKEDFYYKGSFHSIHVIPFWQAIESDKQTYHLVEGEFLVHLFDGASFKTFSVFYNNKLEWDSKIPRIVLDDKNLIEKIGFLIDDHHY